MLASCQASQVQRLQLWGAAAMQQGSQQGPPAGSSLGCSCCLSALSAAWLTHAGPAVSRIALATMPPTGSSVGGPQRRVVADEGVGAHGR